MTKFIPFPPALSELSAKNAAERRRARWSQGQGGARPAMAAYRDADGRLHPAYDPYRPEYPEGSEPGIGEIEAALRHYPNETSGYQYTVASFTPASEFLRDAPRHDPEKRSDPMDRLTIAHVRLGRNFHKESGFIWALDETEMQAWLEALPPEAAVLRATLTRHGLGAEATEEERASSGKARAVLMTHAIGGTEIHVAASAEALARGVKERYSFIDFGDLDGEAALQKVGDFGRERGWIVAHQLAAPHAEATLGAPSIVWMANAWLADQLGRPPALALVRPPVKIFAADISLNGENILDFAYDPQALEDRIADTLSAISGEVFRPDGPESAKSFIEAQVASHGFKVTRGAGEAHLAYGFEPQEFAIVVQAGVEPVAFASNSEANLEVMVKAYLEHRLPGIDMAGDDIYDLAWRICENDSFSMVLGAPARRGDELLAMREKIRLAGAGAGEPGL